MIEVPIIYLGKILFHLECQLRFSPQECEYMHNLLYVPLYWKYLIMGDHGYSQQNINHFQFSIPSQHINEFLMILVIIGIKFRRPIKFQRMHQFNWRIIPSRKLPSFGIDHLFEIISSGIGIIITCGFPTMDTVECF